jgi:hypothetical protein
MNTTSIKSNQNFANPVYKNNFLSNSKDVVTYVKSNIEAKTNINEDISQRKVLASKSEDGYFYLSAADITETARAITTTVAPELLINTLTYQPDLTDNPAEEAALFREMLRPFANLPEKPRQKAILKLIQDRLAEKVTYGFDIDTEGKEEYSSSVAEILADNGNGIDCEDYTNLANFYFDIAQQENMLPKDAKMINLSIPKHMFAVYVSPSYDDAGAEYYVIDTYTASYGRSTFLKWIDSNNMINPGENLNTLQEYADILKKKI